MHNIQHDDTIIDTHEDIYAINNTIDVKDILRACKRVKKQVHVVGAAGIGKSTLCRYIASQWAKGSCFSEYQLLALVPLRHLTADRYPNYKDYSLSDLVKTEVFSCELSKTDEQIFDDQFDVSKTLWILDGYDEIAQNVPQHLKLLLNKLLQTPHHIVTSRPYLHLLSYSVSMEITGFTDENISNYVKQFFKNIGDKSSLKGDALLNYLQLNHHIWDIARIPINLQLICVTRDDKHWSNNTTISMTMLYEKLIIWTCRRYLQKQKGPETKDIYLMDRKKVYENCQKELAVLDSFAFLGIQEGVTDLSPKLLRTALTRNQCTLTEYPDLLNIGLLKSFTNGIFETPIETDKYHYFVHRSFQEYFAARYLVNSSNGFSCENPIKLIKDCKRKPFFQLTFVFTSGLLSKNGVQSSFDAFWSALVEQPLNLLKLSHLQLANACIKEVCGQTILTQRDELIDAIKKWIQNALSIQDSHIHDQFDNSPRNISTSSEPTIIDILHSLLQYEDPTTKIHMLSLILRLPVFNLQPDLINRFINACNKNNFKVSEINSSIVVLLEST